MKIEILGTTHIIERQKREDNRLLNDRDGYYDKTTKKIVVEAFSPEDSELEDIRAYEKEVLRHEIIHAFFEESGLSGNFEHQRFGIEETVVDWIAIQFPKMLKAFTEAECI